MPYELETLKKFAYKGKKPLDLDAHESVIYHTLEYCYNAYRKDPTESTKERLERFQEPVIAFHYGRKS